MARTLIRNKSLEGSLTLPAPLRGVLAVGEAAVSSKTVAELTSLFNSADSTSFVSLTEIQPDAAITSGLEDPIAVDSLQVAGSLTVTGNIVAAQRQTVGVFAEALAASQSANPINFGGFPVGWVAPRAGSLTGLSSQLSAAITGAGTQAVVSVAKNGTVFGSSPVNTFTQAGAAVAQNATAAIGDCTFVAGDVLTLIYTSTAISNTPTVVGTIEVTC